MVGGELSFANGGIARLRLQTSLPVTLPNDRNDLVWPGEFKPTLTDAGRFHPITAQSQSR